MISGKVQIFHPDLRCPDDDGRLMIEQLSHSVLAALEGKIGKFGLAYAEVA